MYETHRDKTRGVTSRGFSTAPAQEAPQQYPIRYEEDELWANYERYIKEVLPVAQAAGVKMQLHPNDPPLDHQGGIVYLKVQRHFEEQWKSQTS